jgi:allantoinase
VSIYDLLIRSPRAIVDGLERSCSVAVRDGQIADVFGYDTAADSAQTVELADDEVLLPGLVDTHVHINEPGRTNWEGFATATRAAAAGGVTTLIDMPLNCIPPTVDVPALRAKQEAAQNHCFVDVGFWGGAVPASLGSLRELHDAGVFGFKAFLLDSGVPEFPPLTRQQLLAAMQELSPFDGLLIVHAEDAETIDHAAPAAGRDYADFLASRPPAAEQTAINHVLDAAQLTGARAHILHLASAAALPALRAARARHGRVTVETCPHYLTLAAEDVPDGATLFKCCPPIRETANQDALWAGLAAGTIDMVVTDHSPCTPELKMLDEGDFGAAWGGVSSLQIGLPVVWSQARARGHCLADVVTWMAQRPAELVGLTRKGRITPGMDADLVIFAPDEHLVIDPARLHHRHPCTPYAGATLTGTVRTTWLRGEIAGDVPRGRLLVRGEE